jgi:hypothetical protein
MSRHYQPLLFKRDKHTAGSRSKLLRKDASEYHGAPHPTSVPVLIDNQRSHSGLASTTLCQTASERGRWTRRIMQTTNDGMWHRSVLSACDRIMFSFFISGIKISQNGNHLAKHKLFSPVTFQRDTLVSLLPRTGDHHRDWLVSPCHRLETRAMEPFAFQGLLWDFVLVNNVWTIGIS